MPPQKRDAKVSGDDVVVAFPAVLEGLPDVPPPELDPYLDAAARCFARYGVTRTSVQDVAAEMGYNRATVYRKVGTIDHQSRLLFVRDLHRFLVALTGRVAGLAGPELVIELAVFAVEDAWAHPVIAKIIADEPQILTRVVASDLAATRDRVLPVLIPLLEAAMDGGSLARRNPTVVASWLLRIVCTLVALPPEIELRAYLTDLIMPVLAPPPPGAPK